MTQLRSHLFQANLLCVLIMLNGKKIPKVSHFMATTQKHHMAD